MVGSRFCAVALTVASAVIWSAPTASAFDGYYGYPGYSYGYPGYSYGYPGYYGYQRAAPYDGNWNVNAQTTRGHCESLQFGLVISGGRIYSGGGGYGGYEAQFGGGVSSSGRVRLSATAGPRTAYGTGRLRSYQGTGTWAGRGPSGTCSGVWSAARY
jgi:hypothetical protein